LDSAEFEARLTRCFAAKSYADLDELMADFPIESRMPRRFALSAAWPLPLPLLLLPLVAVAIVAGILTHGHFFWLAFPLFFFVFRPLIWGRRGYRRRVYGGCWGP
jgi:hypothetical protein